MASIFAIDGFSPGQSNPDRISGFMSERTLPSTGAFRSAGFRLYWVARFLGTFSAQIMGVSLGWQVYDITRALFDLGKVGRPPFLFHPAGSSGDDMEFGLAGAHLTN